MDTNAAPLIAVSCVPLKFPHIVVNVISQAKPVDRYSLFQSSWLWLQHLPPSRLNHVQWLYHHNTSDIL